MKRPVSFEEWQEGLPRRLTSSPVWQFGVYPRAMFLYDLVWFDCERLLTDPRDYRHSPPATRHPPLARSTHEIT